MSNKETLRDEGQIKRNAHGEFTVVNSINTENTLHQRAKIVMKK